MVKVKHEIKLILSRMAIATGTTIFLVAILCGIARYKSFTPHEIVLGTDSGSYRFSYNIPKHWSEIVHGYVFGSQLDLEMENRSDGIINNWMIIVELTDDCYMDSYWNGEFVLKDNQVYITSVDYNDTIDPGETQPFGMVIHSHEEDFIKGGKFIYYEDVRVKQFAFFWLIIIAYAAYIVSEITAIFYTGKNIRMKQKEMAAFRIINQSFITFANTIDAKDSYTKGHSQRVAYYSRELARRLGYDEEFQRDIFYVALLHDIGKIGVQDAILKKSAKLTYDEFNEIKEHTSMGGDILKNFTAIPGIEEGARYHHEKYDGTGYMEGLKGEEIPIFARIIAVADAFDAMSSERCYRNSLDIDTIIDELRKYSGKQFDPEIVPSMICMIYDGIAPVVLKEGQLEQELDEILEKL